MDRVEEFIVEEVSELQILRWIIDFTAKKTHNRIHIVNVPNMGIEEPAHINTREACSLRENKNI